MAFEVHEVGRYPKMEERGHRKKCPYTDLKGDGCDCEVSDPLERLAAMQMLGWVADDRMSEGDSFYRNMGDHCIMITRLIDGWQYRWDKGVGYTVYEVRGFATLDVALGHLWAMLAKRVEESTRLYWEHGAMTSQLKDMGVAPKRLRRPDDEPSVKGRVPLNPWEEPNEHGEYPGDICCQRSMGGVCHEHDQRNYPARAKVIGPLKDEVVAEMNRLSGQGK